MLPYMCYFQSVCIYEWMLIRVCYECVRVSMYVHMYIDIDIDMDIHIHLHIPSTMYMHVHA